jgi:hypothetical protein
VKWTNCECSIDQGDPPSSPADILAEHIHHQSGNAPQKEIESNLLPQPITNQQSGPQYLSIGDTICQRSTRSSSLCPRCSGATAAPCFLMAHVHHSFPFQTPVCMAQSLLDTILQVSGDSPFCSDPAIILPSQDRPHHLSESVFLRQHLIESQPSCLSR